MLDSIDATLEWFDNGRDAALATCRNSKYFRCEGCSGKLVEWAKENMVILLGVGVGVGGAQLVLMFLALWFCQSLGKYKAEKKAGE